MARFDRVIRGGMIVDGSRLPRFRGDIGIKDGMIAEIGHIGPGEADETIDAGGLIVAPGFVDLHTHYDAQLFWDPYCTLSSWHGITSVVIGNCGFGFAPVRPDGFGIGYTVACDRLRLSVTGYRPDTARFVGLLTEACAATVRLLAGSGAGCQPPPGR